MLLEGSTLIRSLIGEFENALRSSAVLNVVSKPPFPLAGEVIDSTPEFPGAVEPKLSQESKNRYFCGFQLFQSSKMSDIKGSIETELTVNGAPLLDVVPAIFLTSTVYVPVSADATLWRV